jgi:glycosyltransferase involved in cell wall biosynthesis
VSAPEALFVGLRGFGFAQSRLPLIRALGERGWRVAVFANRDGHAAAIEGHGVEFLDAGFGAGAIAPGADWRAMRRLRGRIDARPPRLVHLFNAKPVLLGLVALRRRRPGRVVVCTVTGLGHAFVASRLVRGAASLLYRGLLGRADAVVFQNPDDLALFVELGLVERARARLVAGSGVDTTAYRPAPPGAGGARAVTVLMATRLLQSKGVLDYLEAGRALRSARHGLRLLLAGEAAPGHPDAIDEAGLRSRAAAAGVEYLGYRPDLPELLPQVDVFVHPSYYHEGVPRVLLEAAACGVAAITTDLPGCREAVVDGVTGVLVPPRDPARLAREIASLAGDPARRAAMGRAARRLAEERFDIRAITAAQLALYDELLARESP